MCENDLTFHLFKFLLSHFEKHVHQSVEVMFFRHSKMNLSRASATGTAAL